jgi:lysine/ornithine N-monooxygenase
VQNHLPAEGAWWLRERFENHVPVRLSTEVIDARESGSGVELTLLDSESGTRRELTVDHVIAGSGYTVDIDRLKFLDATLRQQILRT